MIRRPQRIAPECVLDVSDNQLLVLLLMVQAQDNQFSRRLGDSWLKKFEHVLVHMGAIFAHLVQAGTGKGIAQRFVRLLPHSVVIGIKEIAEALIKGAIAGEMCGKNKRLKEPTGMRQMPFGRAGLQTRLHHLVFRAERRRQRLCLLSHGAVMAGQRGRHLLLGRGGRKSQNGLHMSHLVS